MADLPQLVDVNGRPLQAGPMRARMGSSPSSPIPDIFYPSSSSYPYTASQLQTQEMGAWMPAIRSPDSEINQYRDRMVARNRDLVRNDGWAAGAIMRILDSTVGATMRLHCNPDYRALRWYSKAFDAKWADEFRQFIEARWRNYWYDIGHYNDLARQLTGGQQFRLSLRHKLVDGDALMVGYWRPDRIGSGAAKYATTFLVVDPDRLSNPYQMMDTKHLRNGVEIDDDGVPLAFHFRKAHQNDWYNALESNEWIRVEREDPDGWRRVFHDFERDRAGQNRGIGIFTPVLAQMKMLARYYGIELQAATIASSLGTYVTSPYDPAMIQDALASDPDADAELSYYQQLRSDWSDKRPALFNGVRVPTLAPGEKIEQVSSAHPHMAFEPFAKEMLRTFAAATGLTTEQITQDWSKSNYSNLRGAVAESWKTLLRRRDEFSVGIATPVFAAWLEEEMARGEAPMPNGAPDFRDERTAFSRCGWLGPGKGYVDQTKEKQGSILGMDAALSTLKREAAELAGEDWEENLDQRAIEVAAFRERGLPLPDWGAGYAANEASQPPEEPVAQ